MNDIRLLFLSQRSRTLWLVLLLTLAPVPLTAWLVTLPSDARLLADFGTAGAAHAWQIGMVLLSTVLFWPLLWLSGRYVTRVERGADGAVCVQVWTLLGSRRHAWTALQGGEIHAGHGHGLPGVQVDAPWTGYRTPQGKTLVVDAQGDFPQGEDVLREAMTQVRR